MANGYIPYQDFFGDLILFKVDLSNHHCMEITEVDVHAIDIANREEEMDDEDEEKEEDNYQVCEWPDTKGEIESKLRVVPTTVTCDI